jgi:hypothetical protein
MTMKPSAIVASKLCAAGADWTMREAAMTNDQNQEIRAVYADVLQAISDLRAAGI